MEFNQAIGTLYRDASHNIGAHSDRPRDIEPASCVFDVSFGGDREFVLVERTDAEQEAWLKNANNRLAGGQQYVNATGRVEDRVTMTHGSAVVLSMSTNSRWAHSVPPPAAPYPAAPRASVVLRNIATKLTKEELSKLLATSKRSKERAAEVKAKRCKQ